MAYIVVEDFKGGLDRRKSIVTAPAGTLYTLVNGHLTRGGEIEKRKAFPVKYTLPPGTFGLAAAAGRLYVFGSGANPGVPAGVTYQRLQHPDGLAMTGIVDADVFGGKVYVVAKFADGKNIAFYDGVLVDDWTDGVARAAMASNAGIAAHLAALINGNQGVTATAASNVVTITGAAGVPFTISASEDNGGSIDDQLALVTTTQAAAGTAETLAKGGFTITGGTSSPGANQITSVKVDGVETLNAPIDWTASNSNTAQLVADAINLHASSPEYTATVDASRVTISAVTGSGATPNGKIVTVTVAGDVTIGDLQDMAGGVDGVSAVPQISQVTIGGTFEPGDKFTVTINSQSFGAGRAAGQQPVSVVTLQKKIYAAAGSSLFFSGLNEPTRMNAGVIGSGVVDMSNEVGGSEDLTALASYQNRLAVFARNASQIWEIDVDPVNNRQIQSLPNIGTFASRSAVSYADSDVFFLSDTGVRSLRARELADIASVYDIGTPIDEILAADLALLTEEQRAAAVGVIEPADGRYSLAIAAKQYVFSFFQSSKISAWSIYEPGFSATDYAVLNGRLYVREGNTIRLYGGDSGNEYDESQVEIILPYLDGGKPATTKQFTGIDAGLEGEWDVYAGFDPTQPDERDLIMTISQPTFGLGRIPMNGESTHCGIRLVSRGGGYARLSNLVLHYDDTEAG